MSNQKVTGKYFIYQLWQTGNIGPHNIKAMDFQSTEGYKTYKAAEIALSEHLSEGKYVFATFVILKTYQ